MFYVRIRQLKFEKMSNQLIKVLNRNVEFLNNMNALFPAMNKQFFLRSMSSSIPSTFFIM